MVDDREVPYDECHEGEKKRKSKVVRALQARRGRRLRGVVGCLERWCRCGGLVSPCASRFLLSLSDVELVLLARRRHRLPVAGVLGVDVANSAGNLTETLEGASSWLRRWCWAGAVFERQEVDFNNGRLSQSALLWSVLLLPRRLLWCRWWWWWCRPKTPSPKE